MNKNLLVIFLMTGLAGCASLTDREKTQTLRVNTSCRQTPVLAFCSAQNAVGYWKFMSNQEVTISKDVSALMVTCRSSYFPESTMEVLAYPNIGFVGNLLAGGVVGAGVDLVNSAGFQYQAQVDMNTSKCR